MAPLALTAWAASAATAAPASNSSLVPRAFDWRRAQLTLDPDCDWSKVGPLTEDVNVACCTRESPCNGQPPRVCPSGGCALAMADLRADPCAPSLEHLLDTAGGGAANGFSEALAGLERSCDGQPDDALIAAVLAFLTAIVAIWALMQWLRRSSFTPFVLYRIVLAAGLLYWVYA